MRHFTKSNNYFGPTVSARTVPPLLVLLLDITVSATVVLPSLFPTIVELAQLFVMMNVESSESII